MGHSAAVKKETHQRIVRIAAKRFREVGIEGIGLADVMKEAGVTIGGFYKHFGRRDELVAEALIEAFLDSDVFSSDPAKMPEVVDQYLSQEHRDSPGTGCALGALIGEMSRCSESVRTIFTDKIRQMLVPGGSPALEGELSLESGRTLFVACALLGAINLSRAVNDPELSDGILRSVRQAVKSFSTEAHAPSSTYRY